MARYALTRFALPMPKAWAMKTHLQDLNQQAQTYLGNVTAGLQDDEARVRIVPAGTSFVINTTASLLVRDDLSTVARDLVPARAAEVALFGRGRGAFVLLEGASRSPSLCDLEIELSAHVTPDERDLLFDPQFGLTQVQIGDGCGSLTMPMSDARLSAMTAAATEIVVGYMETSGESGEIMIGTKAEDSPDTRWRRIVVPPMVMSLYKVRIGFSVSRAMCMSGYGKISRIIRRLRPAAC